MSATLRDHATEDAADRMVRKHLLLVYHVAHKLHDRMGGSVELDDLVGAGSLGLVEAVRSFDHTRGLAFSTYAAPRIRGAMLDDMRKTDFLPRSARRKQRELAGAQDDLERRLQRKPTFPELANQLDLTLEKLWQWQSDAAGCTISMDSTAEFTFTSAGKGNRPVTGAEPALDLEGGRDEEAEFLKAAIAELPERDRLILTLSYFQGLKLGEIGQVLGVTESRVSQIRTRALGRLRERFAELRSAHAA